MERDFDPHLAAAVVLGRATVGHDGVEVQPLEDGQVWVFWAAQVRHQRHRQFQLLLATFALPRLLKFEIVAGKRKKIIE